MKQELSNSGFTLLETILSLALTALLIGMFTTMTQQWIPEWNKGRSRIDHLSEISLMEARLIADLRTAIPMRLQNQNFSIHFDQTHFAFVREPDSIDGVERPIVVEYRFSDSLGFTRRTAIFDSRKPISEQRYEPPVTILDTNYNMRIDYSINDAAEGQLNSGKQFPEAITLYISQNTSQKFPTLKIRLPISIDQTCSMLATFAQCKTAFGRNGQSGPLDTLLPTPANTDKQKVK